MKPIHSLPEELSDVVSRWLERLESSHPGSVASLDSTPEFRADMTKVVAVSEFAANTIVREWPWILACRDGDAFLKEPDSQRLKAFGKDISSTSDNIDLVKQRLRHFHKELNRYLDGEK